MSREEHSAGYFKVLDALARWASGVDEHEAYVERNRELLSDEEIAQKLDLIAVERAEIAQARAEADATAREFGDID